MKLDFLRGIFQDHSKKTALIWNGADYSYEWLLTALDRWSGELHREKVSAGAVVALSADFSPNSVALMLALIEANCIVVPLTSSVKAKKSEYLEISEATLDIQIRGDDSVEIARPSQLTRHPLLQKLQQGGRPGLILFSSGSTGKSKGILHDFGSLLEKFKVRRHSKCMMTFLLFDHIGGVNTLFYGLSNAGTIVTTEERTPDSVCRLIQTHRVQILPTSPTFLNLLLLSGAIDRFDLSSLETVTYGTEVMPSDTLKRLRVKLPHADLVQTYGLSEIGILRSKSESSDSLWVKIGGEGFKVRIEEGMLEVKAESAMMGYLNAPSPFTDDGWFKTGDIVEVKGDYFRILGRKSEIINVGGEKVFPAEVESVIQRMDGVMDVCVRGEPNAITGQIVTAQVSLDTAEAVPEFRKRMVLYCKQHLPGFKIPQRVMLTQGHFHGDRFKKMRMGEK